MATPVASRVTVADAATVIAAADQQSVLVKNIGAVTVYVGASGVTTAAGWPLEVGDVLALDLQGGGLYGIVASGTCAVAVLTQAIR